MSTESHEDGATYCDPEDDRNQLEVRVTVEGVEVTVSAPAGPMGILIPEDHFGFLMGAVMQALSPEGKSRVVDGHEAQDTRTETKTPGPVASGQGAGPKFHLTGKRRHDLPEILAERERLLRTSLSALLEVFPKDTGLALFAFDFGDGGHMSYVSNANRQDMIKSVQEWLDHARAGTADTAGRDNN